jgi:23S rRNA (guanosine2251-2'-O)-methyltransferase
MPYGHGGKTGNHQGIIALVPPIEYAEIKDMLELAKARGEAPFVVVLDGIEDPHNLGSIIRSAECAGAHGVIIPKRRAASVTTSVGKASAGAVEYIKIAKVTNIQSALEELKKAGLWIVGTSSHGTPMAKANLKGPIALVIGSEGDGMAPLTARNCDLVVSIPLRGKIESLNASVAAAVLMFEKLRQDGVV